MYQELLCHESLTLQSHGLMGKPDLNVHTSVYVVCVIKESTTLRLYNGAWKWASDLFGELGELKSRGGFSGRVHKADMK